MSRKLLELLDKYRPWLWLLAVLSIAVYPGFAPYTGSFWPVWGFLIGWAIVFLALRGDRLFMEERFRMGTTGVLVLLAFVISSVFTIAIDMIIVKYLY